MTRVLARSVAGTSAAYCLPSRPRSALEAICLKALAKETAGPFASMDDDAAALTGCLQGERESPERRPAQTGTSGDAAGSKAQDPSWPLSSSRSYWPDRAGTVPPGFSVAARGSAPAIVWP